MRAKKVIAGILLTVMVMENSMTVLAAPVANAVVVTEPVICTEVQETESVSEPTGEETVDEKESESGESELIEISSEIESVFSEELPSETETAVLEETTEPEAVPETETAEEPMTEEAVTETETLSEFETETVSDNSVNSTVLETEPELNYILGRPMTEAEVAAQEALVPDYLPQLEVMPMDGMSDMEAGLNQISLFSENVLPEKYDSRDEGIITSVKNQHEWGTCWSFATMALMESSWLQQFNETIDLSERHLAYFVKNTGYDPLGNASEDTIVPYDAGYYLESGGNLYKSAWKFMNWHGAADEAEYPYSFVSKYTIPEAFPAESAQDIIAYGKNVFFIPTEGATQEEKVSTVKKLIQMYGCVEWSYYHSSSFYNASTAAFYLDTAAYGTNHSITVVGWDDTYSKENFRSGRQPENDGAWIVKNSWGEEFGDGGYIYISYEDKSLGAGNPVAVIVAGDPQDFDNNYFYGNTIGTSQAAYYQSMANVYQIDGDTAQQKIKAVSFMAADDSMPFSIQLYKNPDMTDGVVTNPASGTALLAEPVTGEVGYVGLYTVEIPEVVVDIDDYVSVVITFDSAGWIYYSASSQETDGGVIAVTQTNVTEKGQSFRNYSTSANGWLDGADDGRSFMINLLTENVVEVVTKPVLSYTLDSPKSFSDTINCNLKWVKCSNALWYEVFRAELTDGVYEKIAEIPSSYRTYQDNISLTEKGKTYSYKLAAVYADDNRIESDAVTVDTSGCSLLVDADPKQFMDFVWVSWEEMDGAAGYTLERKAADESSYTVVAEVSAGGGNSYKDINAGLTSDIYNYRLRAYSADGAYSDWKEWSTTNEFTLNQTTTSKFSLRFSKAEGTSYFVINLGGGNCKVNSSNSIVNLGITYSKGIGEIFPCQIDMYASQEAYTNGEAPLYRTGTIYFYYTPDVLDSSIALEDGAISLTWNAASGIDSVYIYKNKDEAVRGEIPYAKVAGTATGYTDTVVDEAGTYYYWLVPAKMTTIGEIYGEAVQKQIEVSELPVDLVSVEEVTEKSVRLTWNQHEKAEAYAIYRTSGSEEAYSKLAEIENAETLTYIDDTILTGKTYSYKVVFVDANGESDLGSAKRLSIKTKPAAPVLAKAGMNYIQVESSEEYEYAICEKEEEAASLTYVNGTGEDLIFEGLTENTEYVIYARTKTEITGEEAVYSTALLAKTAAIDSFKVEFGQTSIAKGETVAVSAYISAGEETENYTGSISWSAVCGDDKECTIETNDSVVVVKGCDAKEILRIENGTLSATGESKDKDVTLTASIKTVSGSELADSVNITIAVGLENVELKVESVNGIQADSLEGTGIGDTVRMYAEIDPYNADVTGYEWSSSNHSVASVTVDTEDNSRAGVEIKGIGTTVIQVQMKDGTISDSIEISILLSPVTLTSVAEKTATSMEVTWEKNGAAESYVVYRKDGNDDTYRKIADTDGANTSYIDGEILTGKTYYYKVTAVNGEMESDLESTEEKYGKTAPEMVSIVEDGVTYHSITVNTIENLEYAIGLAGTDKTTLSYQKATGNTITFEDLEAETTYNVYVRTDVAVTGEESVYGPENSVITLRKPEISELHLTFEKTELKKGEISAVTVLATVGDETEKYTGEIEWSATTASGTACEIEAEENNIVVAGVDGFEILRINDGILKATGESATKRVSLRATITNASGTEVSAVETIDILVPLESLAIKVESVNGTSADSLEGCDIGDIAVLSVQEEPFNADETTLLWKTSDETVMVVVADPANNDRAKLEIKGLGIATITVQTTDTAVKAELRVSVTLEPVVMVSAVEKTAGSIDVTWEKNSSAESYNVYRKDGKSGIYQMFATIEDKEQTVYNDSDILIGKTYYYKVTAVCGEMESDLELTREVSARTLPAATTVAEGGVTFDSVTINSIQGLEYAIGAPGDDKTLLIYRKAVTDTLTFNGLEPNTTYRIYARTDLKTTGESTLYGPVLTVSTLIKAELILSIKDVVLAKGNRLPFTYTITPDNLHYNDFFIFAATDVEGNADTVLTTGSDTVVIKGTDSKEICRISNGNFYATGESEQKDVYISVKRGSLEAEFHVKIHVPVDGLEMKVTSVNEDLSVTSLDNFCIGQKAQIELSVLPVNAEETIQWSSSNEKVAVVNYAEASDRMAELTAVGIGSCEITAVSSDGVKASMTVGVNKSGDLYGIWVSDMDDLSGTLVEKDPTTGEYISENIEKMPVYALNDTTASDMTLVSYVLDREDGGAIRKAGAADGIVYRSSDNAVASVAQDGTVTAVGNGEADIIVYESKGNGIYGSCRVVVTAQNTEMPEKDEYPLDKLVKLSPVARNQSIEAFGLDEKSSCELVVKDQYGKIYESEDEKQMFTYTSSDSKVCMVDEYGVVRPNPNYTGKTKSVKITAALKKDAAGRKVVFAVKLLAEKQIDRIGITCISAPEDAAVTDAMVTEAFEKGSSFTFAVKAYDSKGNVIESPKLKISMSDTKVAKVKDNKDGTVSVTMNKAGRSNLIVTGNDIWKKSAAIQITAIDTNPCLSKTALTLNTGFVSQERDGWIWKASEDISVQMKEGVTLESVKIAGASIGKNTLSDTELTNLALVENEDGSYHISVKENYIKGLSKNAKISVRIKADAECGLLNHVVSEIFTVTVKVVSQEPKITVSEAKGINRFYTSKDETLLIIKTPSIITEAEVMDSEYFTVTELKRGQWYLKFSDPDGTYNAKSAKIALRLTALGYEPVEKKLTVQTPYKAPILVQKTVPLIHLGNEQMKQAEITLYDKVQKTELSGYELIAFESEKLDSGAADGSGFTVSLKDGENFKNNEKVVASISVQTDEWTTPVPLKIAVKVSTKTPKIVMTPDKITLNCQAVTEKATVSLSCDQKNVIFHSEDNWALQLYDAGTREWLAVNEKVTNDWIDISYDVVSQKLQVGIREGRMPAEGNYKFRISHVMEGFETVYKEFSVKVLDEKPNVSITVKGKQDLINRKNGSLVGTLKLKNAISSKAVDVAILSEDGTKRNPTYEAKLLSDGRFTIRFTEEGLNDRSLKKQKVTLPAVVTMENGTVIHGIVRFSLTQANPKVKVPGVQTIYKSMKGLTKEYDFASGLAEDVKLQTIRITSVPKGFTASYKDGNVVVTLNDRGIKAGTYQIKVNLYFEGAAEGTKPVSKTIKVKVVE